MTKGAVPQVAPADRPVFVLGERAAAMELVRALGDTPTLSAMPANRLLADLVSAVDRYSPMFDPLAGVAAGFRPAAWYRDVQLAQLRVSGKARTVEFSGLPILRLCSLFPAAQFLVVRRVRRAVPHSRPLPVLGREKILQIDSEDPAPD